MPPDAAEYPQHAARFRRIAASQLRGLWFKVATSQLIVAVAAWLLASIVQQNGGLGSAQLWIWLPAAIAFATFPLAVAYLQQTAFPQLLAHCGRNLTEAGQLDAVLHDLSRTPALRDWGWHTWDRWERGRIRDFGLEPGSTTLRGRLDALLLRYERACLDLGLRSDPWPLRNAGVAGIFVLLFGLFVLPCWPPVETPWVVDLRARLLASPVLPWALALLLGPLLGLLGGLASVTLAAQAEAVAQALDVRAQQFSAARGADEEYALAGQTGWS